MTKKDKAYLEYHNECFDQLSYAYNQSLKKTKELEAYITLLQHILSHYDISFPPIDKPIKF